MGPQTTEVPILPAKEARKPRRAKTTKRDRGTGAIYPDGDGYRVRVQLEEINPTTGLPRVVKRRVKTHAEAVRLLASLTAQRVDGTLRPATGDTFGGYLNTWLEDHIKAVRQPRTYETYRHAIERFVLPDPIARKRLEDVKPTDVQRLLNGIAAQPKAYGGGETVSRRTVEIVRNVLRGAMNRATKVDRLIPRNPVEGAEVPRTARATPKREAAPIDNVLRMLTVARSDPSYGPLLDFIIGTGARIGEACAIRWSDVDLTNGRVMIGAQLQRMKGQGLVRSERTKTGKGRNLPLPGFVAASLRDLRAGRLISGWTESPDDLVFLNAAGGGMDARNVNTRLARFCKQAGVPAFSAHILRHTMATSALDQGQDLQAVSRAMGHSKTALTADLYGQVLERRSRGVADALETVFSGSGATTGA